MRGIGNGEIYILGTFGVLGGLLCAALLIFAIKFGVDSEVAYKKSRLDAVQVGQYYTVHVLTGVFSSELHYEKLTGKDGDRLIFGNRVYGLEDIR